MINGVEELRTRRPCGSTKSGFCFGVQIDSRNVHEGRDHRRSVSWIETYDYERCQRGGRDLAGSKKTIAKEMNKDSSSTKVEECF